VISSINDRHGYDLKQRDLALATGRTSKQIYSSAVHESAHVRWDNMKNFGTEEDKQKVADFSDTHDSFFRDSSARDDNIRAFAAAYGEYGIPSPGRSDDINKQETFTTMSQAYFGAPRSTATLAKDLGPDVRGEKYLSAAEAKYPNLKGLNDAFRKMINIGK
jgi:hypothetical protein